MGREGAGLRRARVVWECIDRQGGDLLACTRK